MPKASESDTRKKSARRRGPHVSALHRSKNAWHCGVAVLALKTMQRKPLHQVIKPESQNIVSQLAISAGISKQPGHRLGNVAVAISAPVQSVRAVRAARAVQGFHVDARPIRSAGVMGMARRRATGETRSGRG
jgi:hypothetical protein